MKQKNVLVLGSEGMLGINLCVALADEGHVVWRHDIKLNSLHDLTDSNNNFDLACKVAAADFVVFLAFDIGGSKYLEKQEKELTFCNNNIKIMQNVFDVLGSNPTPFMFASSMMTGITDSPYGHLKLIGEDYTKALGGFSIRFWNVFGNEPPGIKAHAITDFIMQAKAGSPIKLLTDGTESRQYMHTQHASEAIIKLMGLKLAGEPLIGPFDMSSNKWMTTERIAQECLEVVHGKVHNATIVPGPTKDRVQKDAKIEPNVEVIKHKGGVYIPDSIDDMHHGLAMVYDYLRNNHSE